MSALAGDALRMGFWEERVVPQMVRWACGHENVDRQRAKVVPRARGRVLEIGMGSGLNLPHYGAAVSEVIGVEPSTRLRSDALAAAGRAAMPVRVLDAVAERLPVEGASIDSVVVTYALCTVDDVAATMAELRRVLVPGGVLHFVEHGLAPDEAVRRRQRLFDPVWRRFAGGCHLTRDVPTVLEESGFELDDVDSMYLPGPRALNWNTWGSAHLR